MSMLFTAMGFRAALAVAIATLALSAPAHAGSFSISTTTPADGATVAGSVNWAVSVSGQTPQRVNFSVDGVNKGSDTSAPFSFGLGTTAYPNGPHTLSATAWRNGATRSTTVTVSFNNSGPVNTVAPSIAGTAAVGSTLTGSPGSWLGNPTTYGYQWSRCASDGTNCAAIASATGSTYAVAPADAGSRLELAVSASNAAGSATSVSASTAVVPTLADTVAPSVPSDLTVSATQSSLSLSWQASNDNVGVAGYNVFLDGVPVGSTATLSYTFDGLLCATTHQLAVSAYDAAGNSSATTTATFGTSACATSTSMGFVTRSGQQLSLNGAPYRFIGFNIWRANVASWNKPPNTGYLVNDGTTLDDTLKGINANGGKKNVFRAWFFQQFALQNGTYNWSAFDKTLQVAQANGFKVIATLADEWSYEGVPFKDGTWFQSGYRSTVEPYEAVPYRQFVQDVVNRYKNNPTILAWELVNEPDVAVSESQDATCTANAGTILKGFVSDVGGLIKSIDPNHLVSLGVAGNGNCGTIEDDYQTVMSDPSIDLCSFHDYYGAANTGAFNTYNGLNVRINQCAALNKPVYIGEVGIHLNTSPVNGSTATRASYLDQKMSTQFGMQGVVGYLPWQYDQRGGTSDDYVFGPGDPALATMDKYALPQ